MRRVDDEKAGAGERSGRVGRRGDVADVEFELQNVGRADRRHRVEEARVVAPVLDRAPGRIDAGRPFPERPGQRLRDAFRLARRFVGRIDQHQAAALLRRQPGVERDKAVDLDDRQPGVAAHARHQRGALLRMQFAQRDAVLRPQQALRDRRRAGVSGGASLGVERPQRRQIGLQQGGDGRRRLGVLQPGDAVAPFARAPRLFPREVVTPGARMRVDEAQRRGLARQIDENAREQRMLEHVGEIAGVKRMAVVHRRRRALIGRAPRRSPARGKWRARPPGSRRTGAGPSTGTRAPPAMRRSRSRSPSRPAAGPD